MPGAGGHGDKGVTGYIAIQGVFCLDYERRDTPFCA